MDKLMTSASPNCRSFVSRSKRFVQNGRGIMDIIMVLKDHSSLSTSNNCSPGQSEDKVFVFKIFVNLPCI